MEKEIVNIELKWSYKPEKFLSEEIIVQLNNIDITFSDGVITANIKPSTYEENKDLETELTKLVEARLQANQLLSHKDFELNKPPARSEYYEDGSKSVYATVSVGMKVTANASVRVIKRDKEGNLISDSMQEKLNEQSWLAENIVKFRAYDDVLDQMVLSYQNAVKDPDNELVHLYEIRDALKKRFGSKNNAINELGITNNEWGVLGEFSSNRPLKQGRHRGQHTGELREATSSELKKARNNAVFLIEKYLEYLDRDDPDS